MAIDVGEFGWGWELPYATIPYDTWGQYPDFQLTNRDFGYTGQLASGNFYTSGGASNLYYDTQTGQYISFDQLAQYDPAAAIEADPASYDRYVAELRDTGLTNDTSVAQPADNGPDLLGGLSKYGPLAAVGGVGLIGLIGTIQKAMQGDQAAVQTLERQVASASPEERQLLSGVLGGVSNLNRLAFGTGGAGGGGGVAPATGPAGDVQRQLLGGQLSREQAIHALAGMTDNPGGLVDSWLAGGGSGGGFQSGGMVGSLEGRFPGEEAAFSAGLGRAGTMGRTVDALTQGMLPGLMSGAQDILGGQQAVLNPLAAAGAALAKGQLNITPELERTVEQAFSPEFGDLATRLIEAARNRGFAGGAELLTQAPASALGQTALRDLQGQMAQAKLGLATGLPTAAANIAGAYNTPAAVRGQLGSNLIGYDQNIINTLLGVAGQGMSNRLNAFSAMSAPLSVGGNILGQAGQNRIAGAGSTTTTTQPQGTLLDAFQPLSSLLSGVGGALQGYAAMNRPQLTLNLGA